MAGLFHDESREGAEVSVLFLEVVTVEVVEELMEGYLSINQPAMSFLARHDVSIVATLIDCPDKSFKNITQSDDALETTPCL